MIHNTPCGLLLFVSLASFAQAATLTVNTTNDSGPGSLRQAVSDANTNAGDDIVVFDASLAGQTITLTSDDVGATGVVGPTALRITDSTGTTTIQGDPSVAGITISGNNARRLFLVDAGASLTIRHLTLSQGRHQGNAGGAGDGNITGGGGGGGSAGLGGAIYNRGTLQLEASLFSGNAARGGAGGTAINGGGSGAGAGGGGLGGVGLVGPGIDGGAGGGPNGGVGGAGLNGNATAGGVGGGGGGGAIQGNGAAGGFGGGGGGGGNDGAGPASAGDGGFGGGGGGGGSFVPPGSTTPGAGGFGGGAGGNGATTGAINNGGGGGGGGAGLGGVVFNEGGTVTASDSTFSGNQALGGAGGGSVGGGGTAGSPGTGRGGAIFSRNGTLTLSGNTFASNTAQDGAAANAPGGGVFALGDGATVTVTINNTILADSTGSTDADSTLINAGVQNVTGGTNVIETSGGGFVAVATSAVDPGLGVLQDNGGPTSTHALPAGIASSAKGTANVAFCGTSDQRGMPRRSGNCDVGAFEVQPDLLTLSSGNSQSATPGQAFTDPLGLVATEGGTQLAGVRVAFSAPTSGARATLSAATQITDASGRASVTATAAGTVGAYQVAAVTSGATANFSLTNAIQASASQGDNQSATVGTAFSEPLVLTVNDTTGAPLVGASVTFTGSGGAADVVFSGSNPVTTDAAGKASISVTANSNAGTYTVSTTVLGSTTSFTLTNSAKPTGGGGVPLPGAGVRVTKLPDKGCGISSSGAARPWTVWTPLGLLLLMCVLRRTRANAF